MVKVLVLQLLLVFLLLEAGLRVLSPHVRNLNLLLYTPSIQTNYDEFHDLPALMQQTVRGFTPFEVRSGFVLNSRSFRTREYTGEKRPDIYRIVAIGDSFTLTSGGTPYDHMWTFHLEHELNQKGLREVEVLALAVGAVGTAFELRLWELERDLLRPELVVLAFFVGNDFTNAYSIAPWEEPLARHFSHVFRLTHNLYRLWQERDNENLWEADPADSVALDRGGVVYDENYTRDPRQRTFSKARYLEIQGEHMRISMKEEREWFERRAGGIIQVLNRFDDEVRRMGAEFVVMIIPDEYQVNEALQRRVLKHLHLRPEDIDLTYPQRRLAAFFDERGIAYLDLLPVFREHGAEEQLYWKRNTHWNLEGNALAGATLARYLEAHVLTADP